MSKAPTVDTVQRVHMGTRPLPWRKNLVDYTPRLVPNFKPRGIWYGIGGSWLEWCKSEMPGWIGRHFYELDLDMDRLLVLRTTAELRHFTDEYGVAEVPPYTQDKYKIDWAAVAARGYCGIEISPYNWASRYDLCWYYGWDCASGCVWNPKAVLSRRKIAKDDLVTSDDD